MHTGTWVAIPLVLTVVSCTHFDEPQAAAQMAGLWSNSTGGPVSSSGLIPYTWHDGTTEHRVWMDPAVIAEVGSSAPARQALAQASLLADQQAGTQMLRYWRVDEGLSSTQLLARLKRDRTPGRFSPVLHDTPSPDGPIRLLPGNVVVILDPAWSNDVVGQWVERRHVRVLSTLPFGPNMLLLESEPGLAALDLANTLYQTGEVKAAFPDWLAQKSLK